MLILDFYVDTTIRLQNRSIYNGLDLLGDVGGLYDGLKLVLGGLISLLTQGGVAVRIINSLFYTVADPRRTFPEAKVSPDKDKVDSIRDAVNYTEAEFKKPVTRKCLDWLLRLCIPSARTRFKLHRHS